MMHTNGLLEIEIKGSVSKTTPDNTIGLVTTHDPERFPDSLIVDPERLERALIAVREEFDNPGAVNMALVIGDQGDDTPHLAFYPEGDRDRAIVIAPRHRQGDDGGPEAGELQRIETDAEGD
jgi:hypothetical protein